VSTPTEKPDITRSSRKPRRSPGAQSQRTARRARVASSCSHETSDRVVRVRAIRRNPPDLDRFVAALIALALTEHPDEQGREPERGECA
jgi:hypothetical protein